MVSRLTPTFRARSSWVRLSLALSSLIRFVMVRVLQMKAGRLSHGGRSPQSYFLLRKRWQSQLRTQMMAMPRIPAPISELLSIVIFSSNIMITSHR